MIHAQLLDLDQLDKVKELGGGALLLRGSCVPLGETCM